jgi:hypothetical protein
MTTYKKHSIKNRKTRKIKKPIKSRKQKGGVEPLSRQSSTSTLSNSNPNPNQEPLSRQTSTSTLTDETSTNADNSIKKPRKNKKVSILIDFYEKLLKPENYGNKLNFNKFYENININKQGMNMTESVTGVEELFEIFKKELEYIKATGDEKNKKEKAIKSNLKKTKEIIIDFKREDGGLSNNDNNSSIVTA